MQRRWLSIVVSSQEKTSFRDPPSSSLNSAAINKANEAVNSALTPASKTRGHTGINGCDRRECLTSWQPGGPDILVHMVASRHRLN